MTPTMRPAWRTYSFRDSAIREMMRLAARHDAVNLAPGIPDLPTPELIREAACAAIRAGANQYTATFGAPALRRALADKYAEWYGLELDPEREVTVTCGSTEAMACVMLALLDPGDEVVIVEPFFENFPPHAQLTGARPVYLPLQPPDFRLEQEALAAVLTSRTRAVLLNSPNNPTGRVFDRTELAMLAHVCQEHDLLAITDEIYEHLVYDGVHSPLASFAGMRERTITVSGLSKAFRITGWRIGTIVAPGELTTAIRKVHDLLTVGAPTPLQEACAVGLRELGRDYYDGVVAEYRQRRDVLVAALQDAGFDCRAPEGAYYVLADFSSLADEDDNTFARRLVQLGRVAAVPGSGFFHHAERGRSFLRFAFCQNLDTLQQAARRLRAFSRRPSLVSAS